MPRVIYTVLFRAAARRTGSRGARARSELDSTERAQEESLLRTQCIKAAVLLVCMANISEMVLGACAYLGAP